MLLRRENIFFTNNQTKAMTEAKQFSYHPEFVSLKFTRIFIYIENVRISYGQQFLFMFFCNLTLL